MVCYFYFSLLTYLNNTSLHFLVHTCKFRGLHTHTWTLRISRPPGIIYRTSKHLFLRNIIMYDCTERHFCFIPFLNQAQLSCHRKIWALDVSLKWLTPYSSPFQHHQDPGKFQTTELPGDLPTPKHHPQRTRSLITFVNVQHWSPSLILHTTVKHRPIRIIEFTCWPLLVRTTNIKLSSPFVFIYLQWGFSAGI